MYEKLVNFIINMREKEALDIARDLVDAYEDPLKILDNCSKAMIDFSREYGVY